MDCCICLWCSPFQDFVIKFCLLVVCSPLFQIACFLSVWVHSDYFYPQRAVCQKKDCLFQSHSHVPYRPITNTKLIKCPPLLYYYADSGCPFDKVYATWQGLFWIFCLHFEGNFEIRCIATQKNNGLLGR